MHAGTSLALLTILDGRVDGRAGCTLREGTQGARDDAVGVDHQVEWDDHLETGGGMRGYKVDVSGW